MSEGAFLSCSFYGSVKQKEPLTASKLPVHIKLQIFQIKQEHGCQVTIKANDRFEHNHISLHITA